MQASFAKVPLVVGNPWSVRNSADSLRVKSLLFSIGIPELTS